MSISLMMVGCESARVTEAMWPRGWPGSGTCRVKSSKVIGRRMRKDAAGEVSGRAVSSARRWTGGLGTVERHGGRRAAAAGPTDRRLWRHLRWTTDRGRAPCRPVDVIDRTHDQTFRQTGHAWCTHGYSPYVCTHFIESYNKIRFFI